MNLSVFGDLEFQNIKHGCHVATPIGPDTDYVAASNAPFKELQLVYDEESERFSISLFDHKRVPVALHTLLSLLELMPYALDFDFDQDQIYNLTDCQAHGIVEAAKAIAQEPNTNPKIVRAITERGFTAPSPFLN